MARKTQLQHERTERLGGRPTRPMDDRILRPAFTFALQEGDQIGDRYKVIRKFAQQTGEADVYLCTDDNNGNTEVVLKLYRGMEGAKDEVLGLLKGVKHPDIIALLDYGVWQEHFYEVMEYAKGGSLIERLPASSFSEDELIRSVIPEVTNALEFCHSRSPRIIHRDLKPSNIFYRNENKTDIVIGDFGISSILEASETHRATTASRTPDYAAPEVYSEQMGIEADYYGFGITLIHLFSGHSPMQGLTERQIMFRHLSEEIALPDGMSERLKLLVRGLLVKERGHRWKAQEIRRWLAGENVPVYRDVIGVQIQPYELPSGLQVRSIQELAKGLHDEWNDTIRRDVGRGYISRWLATFNQGMARRIGEIEESDLELDLKVLSIIYTLDPNLPFRLLPEKETNDPRALVRMIDENEESWQVGRDKLYKGYIPTWLRVVGHEDPVRKWQSLNDEIHKDQDRGLEVMLELLDPDLPKPSVKVDKIDLALGRIEMGSSRNINLIIENKGRGYMVGHVRCEQELEGISVSNHVIRGKRTEIEITLDATRLPAGRRGRTNLVIDTNSNEKLEIPLFFNVGMPLSRTLLRVLLGMTIGATIFGVYRTSFSLPSLKGKMVTALIILIGALVVWIIRKLIPKNNPLGPLFAFRDSDFSATNKVIANIFGFIFPWMGTIAATYLAHRIFLPYEKVGGSLEVIGSLACVFIAPAIGSATGTSLALSLHGERDNSEALLGGFGCLPAILFAIGVVLAIIFEIIGLFGVKVDDFAYVVIVSIVAAIFGNIAYFRES